MGATWSVKVVTLGSMPAHARAEIDRAIRDDLALVNRRMSTWDPDSELSRFNASASVAPVAISRETFDVLQGAVEINRLTGGAFDITLAPLVDAWGFGAVAAPSSPDEATLAGLREAVGANLLELDEAGPTARKKDPRVRCDVSAIAPGYAADRLAALLAARGYGDFLVDVGGELVARGRNDRGTPWQVAIERPQVDGRAIERTVSLRDLAIATSGDYRKYHEVDGRRVAHVVDPRTARPIEHRLASASVVHGDAMRADALATAMMVLGPDEGLALAEREHLAVLFLVRNAAGGFDERASSRFAAVTGSN